jgi:threonine dehydratase
MDEAGRALLDVALKDVEDAAERVRGVAYPTPVVPAGRDEERVFLKLECLQRLGSFKVRGAWNRMSRASEEERRRGFVTVSAGNHGQAVAWCARRLAAPCTVWTPEGASRAKVESMERMGATVRSLPHEEIMEAMATTSFPRAEGATYVHPFGDPRVVAGAGTVGLEVARDVAEVATVLVPVGGGGLSTGVALAVKSLRPRARVLGVQAAGSAPLPLSFEQDRPSRVRDPSTFADGMKASRVFDYMWPVLRARLDGALRVSDAQLEDAIRFLRSEAHVVAEGAGAAGLAAARAHPELPAPVVAIVSGGNIDASLYARIVTA